MRVLILDFDFFCSPDGELPFYRRVVERHPEVDFWYPSRGVDVRAAARGELPPNAHPFAIDPLLELGAVPKYATTLSPHDELQIAFLAPIAMALQGNVFDVVEVPGFLLVTHLIRPLFALYGIVVGRISLGVFKRTNVSATSWYSDDYPGKVTQGVEFLEARSFRDADIVYTFSQLHAADKAPLSGTIDLHDLLDEFPMPAVEPPGRGAPDVWYVGHLDGTAGAEFFLEITARVPKHLFGSVGLAGAATRSTAPDRSGGLLAQALRLGLDAVHIGQKSDAELRREVYFGRTVLVIPSRTDGFNCAAAEALVSGCPVLLSANSGAADFLRNSHPELPLSLIESTDVEGSAQKLTEVLENYDAVAQSLRAELRRRPFPKPKHNFMLPLYQGTRANISYTGPVGPPELLLPPAAQRWRPARGISHRRPMVACVVVVRDAPAHLAATLSCLARQSVPELTVVVADDGSVEPDTIRDVAASFQFRPKVLRQGRQGQFWAANRGWQSQTAEFVAFFTAGDILRPELLSSGMHELMNAADTAVCVPPWSLLVAQNEMPLQCAGASEAITFEGPSRWIGPGMLLRRQALEAIGGFDISVGRWAPLDLVMRLMRGMLPPTKHGSEILAWRPSVFAVDNTSLEEDTRRLQRVYAKNALPIPERPVAN